MTHAIEAAAIAGVGRAPSPGDDDDSARPTPNETSLPASVPLLLLPVRFGDPIRCRNQADSARRAPTVAIVNRPSTTELLLRVYPDTISTSSFEPELTSDEIAAGTAYWQARWSATGHDPGRDAWTTLANRFGPARAAWIAATMTPTNLGSTDATPTFPSPATRASSYEKPPTTQALPGHWTVVLQRGTTTRTVQGSTITPDLAVGFTPHDGQLPDGLPVDAGMRWLVDFAEAEQVGMGIRIPLTRPTGSGLRPHQRASASATSRRRPRRAGVARAARRPPLHRRAGPGPARRPDQQHHRRRRGVHPRRPEPGHQLRRGSERRPRRRRHRRRPGAGRARSGCRRPPSSHVRYADGHGGLNSADMVTALWPATIGYFLEQLDGPGVRRRAAGSDAHLRPGQRPPARADPALRVGPDALRRPADDLAGRGCRGATGPLPTPGSSTPTSARGPCWPSSAQRLLGRPGRRSAAAVPHIGASADPDADLAQVLGMDASSLDYRGRRVVGDDLLWNLLTFLDSSGPPSEEWWTEHLARGRALLDWLGLTSWDPRVIHTAMGRDSYPVPYPSVQDRAAVRARPAGGRRDPRRRAGQLHPMAGPCPDGRRLGDENYPGPKPTSILYRVLRQSMLREYVTQAGRAQVSRGVLAASALREAELVNIAADAPTITARDIVERPSRPVRRVTWAEFLDTSHAAAESPLARLADLRASMDRLATLPTAELDRLLSETLDAAQPSARRVDHRDQHVAAGQASGRGATRRRRAPPALHLGALRLGRERPPRPQPRPGGHRRRRGRASPALDRAPRAGHPRPRRCARCACRPTTAAASCTRPR